MSATLGASAPAAALSAAPYMEADPELGDVKRVGRSASVPSPPPPATPTPTPDPAVWRFEGRVVDETGGSLQGVCVVIGPRGCQTHSPHSDDRGVYFIDVPQVPTIWYELRFQKEGFETIYYRARPTGPTVFHVVLRRV